MANTKVRGVCSIEGCGKPHFCKNFCQRHFDSWRAHGDPLASKVIRIPGSGTIGTRGYWLNGRHLTHRIIAEKVVGRILPPPIEVHHADGNKTNNANANLVVCQDRAYHKILHYRMRSYEATGSANFGWCKYCKSWDNKELMVKRSKAYVWFHRACDQARRKT